MLTLLPLLSFLFLGLTSMSRGCDFRTAVLAASVMWGVLFAAVTELLGLVNGIALAPLIAVWIGINVVLTSIVAHRLRRSRLRSRVCGWRLVPRADSMAVMVFAAGIVVTEAVIALRAPPNTWDCMSYHMSRVAHWIQNRSVAFYPTHILRQNHQMPWAEFAVMHLQLLSGGDRFANMVQWFSMLGSALGVSVIARELGARGCVQCLSSIVCLTIPMGILQATSAKNDYALSLWCVALVVFLMKTIRAPSAGNMALTGASLGLALLTKGTAYVYAAPLLILGAAGMLARRRKQWLKAVAVIAGMAFILNAPHYSRNFRLYGSPLGPAQEGRKQYSYANERLSIPITVSNLIRNLGLHLTTSSEHVNRLVEKSIYAILGEEVNNPSSTWGETVFRIRTLSCHEERTGNLAHALLIMLSAAIILLSRSRSGGQRVYVAFVLMAAVSFCAFLRWQPWHNRLHLPLFVLAAPIVALGVSALSESPRILNGFGMVMMAAAMPWLLCNPSRPLIAGRSIFSKGRIEQYFADRALLTAPYRGAVDYVAKQGIRNVGLLVDADDYEYPLWVLLQGAYRKEFRLEHVGVRNLSRTLRAVPFEPEAVIATMDLPETLTVEGRNYRRAYFSEPVSVFRKAAEAGESCPSLSFLQTGQRGFGNRADPLLPVGGQRGEKLPVLRAAQVAHGGNGRHPQISDVLHAIGAPHVVMPRVPGHVDQLAAQPRSAGPSGPGG